MKKVIILTTVISLAFVSVSFCMWKTSADFNTYKEARKTAADAEALGDTATAVANYKKAAELAGMFATEEIQAWQINNAAFALIKKFKVLVAYDEKLTALAEMTPGKEKFAFQKEMTTLFASKIELLNEAKALLVSGETINGGEAPMAKMQSNVEFIDWVLKFIADNSSEALQTQTPVVVPTVKAEEIIK
ncbi:MAG: hypothetical protein WCJ94_07720 [bacterium]